MKKIKKIAGIITSSRPNTRYLKRTIKLLERDGRKVLLSPLMKKLFEGKFVRASDSEFASPIERLKEIEWAISNSPDIIVSATGGYGAGRIIPLFDKKMVKDVKIPLMGFSDVTSLLNYWAALGNPAFLGPCLEEEEDVIKAIRILETCTTFSLQSPKIRFVGVNKNIKVKGVFGGNITCFICCITANLDFLNILPASSIVNSGAFIFEDLFSQRDFGKRGGKYSFQYCLDMLEIMEIFKKVTIWGGVSGVKNFEKMVLKRAVKKPVVFGIPFGHYSEFKIPIPLGYDVSLEILPDKKEIRFTKKWR